MKLRAWFLVISLAALYPAAGISGVLTFDFESFAPGDVITTQIPGLTILNGIILTAGVNYNDAELPPHSGINVLSDDGGAITIDFTTPVLGFRGYFTYLHALTLTAFDVGLGPVGTDTSAFGSNLALTGDAGSTPNEILEVNYAAGISRVVIEGNPAGGSFVLDDARIVDAVIIPEPGSFILIGIALTAALLSTRRKSARLQG